MTLMSLRVLMALALLDINEAAIGFEGGELMGLIGGPVDDIASDQCHFPVIPMSFEAALGDDGDVVVGLVMRVHGEHIVDLREVVLHPRKITESYWAGVHHSTVIWLVGLTVPVVEVGGKTGGSGGGTYGGTNGWSVSSQPTPVNTAN